MSKRTPTFPFQLVLQFDHGKFTLDIQDLEHFVETIETFRASEDEAIQQAASRLMEIYDLTPPDISTHTAIRLD